MGWDRIDEKKIKIIIKQLSGTMTAKDGDLMPRHIIKGKGDIWCYQIATRTFVRIQRGSSIYILDWGIETNEQCLAYSTDNTIFTIDKDEIIEIGFD